MEEECVVRIRSCKIITKIRVLKRFVELDLIEGRRQEKEREELRQYHCG